MEVSHLVPIYSSCEMNLRLIHGIHTFTIPSVSALFNLKWTWYGATRYRMHSVTRDLVIVYIDFLRFVIRFIESIFRWTLCIVSLRCFLINCYAIPSRITLIFEDLSSLFFLHSNLLDPFLRLFLTGCVTWTRSFKSLVRVVSQMNIAWCAH